MHAVRIHTTGSPDVLAFEDAPEPEPGEHEVRIAVQAASVNPIDYKIRSGRFPAGRMHFPLILGRDVAGVVEMTGPRVNEWQVGDEVYAMLGAHSGGYAEYAIAGAGEVAPKPRNFDAVHAAAVPLAALTAWQGLFEHGRLERGQRVLIHGAGGGVGHFAVQFAHHHGAVVIATAATEDVALVRELGADEVIDFRSTPFHDRVDNVDLVLDLVAGETQQRSWLVLRDGGMLVSSLGDPVRGAGAPPRATGKGYLVRPDGGQLREIGTWIEEGHVRVCVTHTLRLADAREAHNQLESQHSQGKTVLTVA